MSNSEIPQQRVEPKPSEPNHSFSVGVWLTILGIVAAAVAAFVRLESRVNQLDPTKISEAQNIALRAITSASQGSTGLPVGTIVASIIEPTKFKELYGDNWVLADGRKIINTPLETAIEKDSLPDLGGQFLRGINTKDDRKNQDPEGTREPGSRQPDAVGPHKHTFKNATGKDPVWGGNSLVHPIESYTDEQTSDPIAPQGVETRPRNVAVYYYIRIR